MSLKDEKGNRRHLQKAIHLLKKKLAEKEFREREEQMEEERAAEEAERARSLLLAECADEKEALGAHILEKIKQLRRDQLISKVRRYTEDEWSEFVPIHERKIIDMAELLPGMPTDREVTEIFQLSRSGVLTYNQIYRALHFSEGMMQFHVRRDPLRFGSKLEKPADFRGLSITTVKQLLEALDTGGPYRLAAQSLAKNVDGLEKELACTSHVQRGGKKNE